MKGLITYFIKDFPHQKADGRLVDVKLKCCFSAWHQTFILILEKQADQRNF